MSTEAARAAVVDKPAPPDPSVRKFARFFKTYGFSLGLVVAALPFGLQWTNFLGYYHSNGSYLTFVASLVCFLCVAAVFGARQHIGHIVFPARRTLTPKGISARKDLLDHNTYDLRCTRHRLPYLLYPYIQRLCR